MVLEGFHAFSKWSAAFQLEAVEVYAWSVPFWAHLATPSTLEA